MNLRNTLIIPALLTLLACGGGASSDNNGGGTTPQPTKVFPGKFRVLRSNLAALKEMPIEASMQMAAQSPTANRTVKMKSSHGNSTSLTLKDGRVLVIGGGKNLALCTAPVNEVVNGVYTWFDDSPSGDSFSKAVDVFDPNTETFGDPVRLHRGRKNAATVVMPDGRVAVFGGNDVATEIEVIDPQNMYELQRTTGYGSVVVGNIPFCVWGGNIQEPQTHMLDDQHIIFAGTNKTLTVHPNTWELHQPMVVDTTNWSTVVAGGRKVVGPGLNSIKASDGKVYFFGGDSEALVVGGNKDVTVYNPLTRTMDLVATMPKGRAEGVVLNNPKGTITIMGGYALLPNLNSEELKDVWDFDPVTRTFTHLPDMIESRYRGAGSMLVNGYMTFFGGVKDGYAQKSQLIYDYMQSKSSGFTAEGMASDQGRTRFTTQTLLNGRVVILGGAAGSYETGDMSNTAEIFEPESNVYIRTVRSFIPANGYLEFAAEYNGEVTWSVSQGRVEDQGRNALGHQVMRYYAPATVTEPYVKIEAISKTDSTKKAWVQFLISPSADILSVDSNSTVYLDLPTGTPSVSVTLNTTSGYFNDATVLWTVSGGVQSASALSKTNTVTFSAKGTYDINMTLPARSESTTLDNTETLAYGMTGSVAKTVRVVVR